MKKAVNGNLLTSPFPEIKSQVAARGGLPSPTVKEELVPLKVIVGNDNIPTGATAWVKKEVSANPLSRTLLQVDGQAAIVVADIHVLYVED